MRIRDPIVQGIFYPDTADELEAEVSRFLADADKQLSIKPGATAIVSPHAGYPFCGTYMGAAFLAAAGRRVETVVIIAPVHREPEDAIFLTESMYFTTPFGQIEVADDLVSELEASGTRIFRNDIPHLEEHAIECQLPFIQHQFPKARIVPILLGRTADANVRLLGKILDMTFAGIIDTTLFVVSSNLSNHPNGETAAGSVNELMRLIGNADCGGLVSAYQKKEITACGSGCIAALFCGSQGRGRAQLLSKTPTDIESNTSGGIIHYGAIAFYPPDKPAPT